MQHEPDVVLACAGDIPTQEALAAVALLKSLFHGLKIRFVNVVDLFTLVPPAVHPHGLPDEAFDALFTADKPVLFNFHGYPALIHRLCYRRRNHAGFHVHGYREEGDLNTPFELAVLNGIDRYSLAMDVLERVPRLRGCAPAAASACLRSATGSWPRRAPKAWIRKRFAMAGGPTKGWRMRDGRARARRRKPAPIGPPALGAGLITGAADDDPSGIATIPRPARSSATRCCGPCR